MAKPKDPLELSIDAFIKQAQEYHNIRVAGPAKDVNDTDFRTDLKNKWSALELARNKISCEAWIEYDIVLGLEERGTNPDYVGKSDDGIEDAMFFEEHHPTEKLKKNMLNVGKPAPDKNFSCHHIVEGKGYKTNKLNGKVVQRDVVVNTRILIHEVGIGINDAGNGVWLPASMDYVPHSAMPKALPHANIHTMAYEDHVLQRVSSALRDEQSIRTALNVISNELQTSRVRCFLTKKSGKHFSQALTMPHKKFA